VLIVFNQKHFPFNFRPTIVTAFKDNHAGIKLSNSSHEKIQAMKKLVESIISI
jgi:hypothetical protein